MKTTVTNLLNNAKKRKKVFAKRYKVTTEKKGVNFNCITISFENYFDRLEFLNLKNVKKIPGKIHASLKIT